MPRILHHQLETENKFSLPYITLLCIIVKCCRERRMGSKGSEALNGINFENGEQ